MQICQILPRTVKFVRTNCYLTKRQASAHPCRDGQDVGMFRMVTRSVSQ